MAVVPVMADPPANDYIWRRCAILDSSASCRSGRMDQAWTKYRRLPIWAGDTGKGPTAAGAVSLAARPDRAPRVQHNRPSNQLSNDRYLSWLSFYRGFVWVKRDDGFVTRIDPRSNKPSGAVGAYTDQQHYCQGIGAGGGAVWSCSGSNITRIDPGQMKIVASIPAGKVFGQGRLVFADGRLWVITGRNGDRLVGIDAATNRPGPPIKLPVGCSDLAPGIDAVWVLCPTANRVVKVDVAHRSIVGTLALAGPYAGFGTRTDLWVGSDRGLVRVDAKSLKPVALFKGLNPGAEGVAHC
jgi:hypothetical protein